MRQTTKAVPRSHNGRETIALHRICHAAIHAALSEKELERQYNMIEKLREPAAEPLHRLGTLETAGILRCARGGRGNLAAIRGFF